MPMKDKTVTKVDQSWFWTKRWQQGEKEADDDIEAGRVYDFPDAESAIASLNNKASKTPLRE
jgi:hypothetical protein